MATRIQIRHDTTINWAAANPVLAIGELGLDITLNRLKYGDGITHWLDLAFDLTNLLNPSPTLIATAENQTNTNLANLQTQVNNLTAQVNALAQILIDKGLLTWHV